MLVLLVYVIMRFNAAANPVPSRTTHNTLVEVLWTVVPVVILVAIAIPSFRLLYFQRDIPKADMTVKIIGNQWNWTYEYPDQWRHQPSFRLSQATSEAEAKGEPCLLAADMPVVVPVNKTVRIIVTASDVIHAWAIPAFGMKIDAIPGRLNEDWFKAKKGRLLRPVLGTVRQGPRLHADQVHVVPEADFNAWAAEDQDAAGADEAREASCRRGLASSASSPRQASEMQAGRRLARLAPLQLKEVQHMTHGHAARWRSCGPPDRMAPLCLFDQPQGHRHDVSDVRHRGGGHRRRSCRS